jgi:hypothetical protein
MVSQALIESVLLTVPILFIAKTTHNKVIVKISELKNGLNINFK